MIIFASILTAIDVIISGLYQRVNGNNLKSGLQFNFLVGIFTLIIFSFKFTLNLTLYSLVLAGIMTTFAMAYIIIGFKILADGKVAYYTFFRMVGSMLLPYIWGIFFLDEKFSAQIAVGMVLMIFSVFLFNSDKSNINAKTLVLCIFVFFLSGFVNIISKQHSISIYAVSEMDYIFLTASVKVILCGILLLFSKKREASLSHKSKVYILSLCALSALTTGIAYVIQLISAKTTPASLLFPIITGGTIIFSAFFARIAFKETLPKKSVVAIIICFIGTLLFV